MYVRVGRVVVTARVRSSQPAGHASNATCFAPQRERATEVGGFFAFDVCRARRMGLVVPGWAEMGSCATDRLEGALGRLDLQGTDTSILTPGKQGLHFVM